MEKNIVGKGNRTCQRGLTISRMVRKSLDEMVKVREQPEDSRRKKHTKMENSEDKGPEGRTLLVCLRDSLETVWLER